VIKDGTNDLKIYRVIVNHEGQYSILLAERAIPFGWDDVGKSGPRQECLAYIGKVWTDMQPISVRSLKE